MIVDTHLHVWRLHSERYPWQPLADVAPDYEWPIEKEIEVMDKYGVDKGVLIQPSMYGFVNRYLLDCGRSYPGRFALVGLVDPQADSVESDMESLVEQSVQGLRLAPMLRPDILWYNDSQADRIWRKASQLEIILTLLVKLDQVPTRPLHAEGDVEAVGLVRRQQAHGNLGCRHALGAHPEAKPRAWAGAGEFAAQFDHVSRG